ncbi:hypothetical protein FACS189454_00600 [Planctomycetales bacterium]|nr:hypothetical protein FACS189454_00600 [Planctomycetales bacterium]
MDKQKIIRIVFWVVFAIAAASFFAWYQPKPIVLLPDGDCVLLWNTPATSQSVSETEKAANNLDDVLFNSPYKLVKLNYDDPANERLVKQLNITKPTIILAEVKDQKMTRYQELPESVLKNITDLPKFSDEFREALDEFQKAKTK